MQLEKNEQPSMQTFMLTKEKLLKVLKPLLPSPSTLENTQIDLERAGVKYSAEEFYAFRWTLAITLGVFMSLLYIPYADKMLIFGGATFGLSYLLPHKLVSQKIKARQRNAQFEVLDFIDLVANGMEAGLDLNNSIDKVTIQMPGVLAEEFQRTFSEIDLGRRREAALRSLTERLDIEDVTLLIDAIIQAEKTGVPMAKVLKDQAKRIRNNYKTNALKIAQAASIKMLAPMILFILPALFIVVLGPPFIGIGKLMKF